MKRNYFLLLLLTVLLTSYGFPQDAGKIPAYKKQLLAAKSDTERVHVLSMLCFHYSTVNADTALAYGFEGMRLAKKLEPKWTAHMNNSIGWAYLKKNQFDTAEQYFLSALKMWESVGDKKSKKVVVGNLGALYMERVDYTRSMQYLDQALKLDDEIKDTLGKAIDTYNLGRLYNLQGNYMEARNYFEQSYELTKLVGATTQMAEALLSIGNTYQSAGEDDKALLYYSKCLAVFKKINDASRIGLTYENMAGSFKNKKQFDQAIQYYLLANKEYVKTGNKTDQFYGISGLADTYKTLKNYPLAESSFKQAMEYAVQLNDKNLQYQCATNLADLYKDMGDYTNAYGFLKTASIIKDSLFTRAKQQELLKLQTQFETERKDRENKLLKAQNDAANATLQRNRIFLFVAIFGLLLLGSLLFLIYKNKEAKAKHILELELLNRQLNEQQKEINDFNTLLKLKALRSQMNPHFIFNCMSSIQECMLTGRIDDASTYLTKLSRLLRMVLNYADEENITLDKELEMLMLYLQLEKIRLKNGFEYTIEMDDEVLPEEINVPTLILQPFAENAIWHGLLNKEDNRTLSVRGRIENDMLHLSVEDNGIGRTKATQLRSAKKSHESKGLQLIEKRLLILRQQYNKTAIGFKIHDLFTRDNLASGTNVEINLPVMPT